MNAKQLLNKQLLIGRVVLDEQGNIRIEVYKSGTITRLIESGLVIQQLNGEEQISVLAGVMVTRNAKYTFKLPICPDCAAGLEARIQLRNWIIGGSVLLSVFGFIIWCLAAYQHIGSLDLGMWLTLIGVLIAIPTFLIFRRLGKQLGAFDGAQFKFKNRNFHNHFAVLYPPLVKLRSTRYGANNSSIILSRDEGFRSSCRLPYVLLPATLKPLTVQNPVC